MHDLSTTEVGIFKVFEANSRKTVRKFDRLNSGGGAGGIT